MLALGKLFEAGALVCKLLGISKTTSVDEAQRDGFRAILAGISCLSSQIADVNNAISDRDNKSIVHDFSTKMSNLEDVETKKINVDLMDAYAAINNHLPTEADDITECLPALIYFSEQHRSEADDYIIQVNQFMTAIVKEMEDPYSEYNPFHALDNCFAHDTYFYAEHGGKIAQYRYSVMLQLIKSFNLAAAIQRGIVYSDIRNRSTLSGTELDSLCLAAYARALSSGLGQNYNDASDTLKPYLDNFNNGIRLELRNDGYYTSNLKAAVYSCFCYPLHKQVAFEVLTAYTLGNTGMVIPTNASDHGMTPLGLRDRFFRSQFTDGSITNGRAADALKVLNLYYGSDYYAPYRKLAAPAMSLNGQVGADASRTPDRFRFALRGYANNKSAGNERWGTYDIYGAEGRGLIEDNNYHLTYPEAVTNKDLGIYRWTPYYLPDSPRMATIVLTHRSSSK
ncbi:MAG: hypothetical protein BWY98_01031 [Tenericutes bacterium ADurb.BinA155]|nr:MAG: hypothetical protein BWY98_01031 [Tenericutes bacterium ADurb.BinA155]